MTTSALKLADIGNRLMVKNGKNTEEVANNVIQNIVNTVEKVGDQMVFWPEDAAAMPTELTRVSLFSLPSDKRGARKMLDDVKLDSRSDVQVKYTGKQLNAKDETAWLACLRIGRGIPMGERIYRNKSELMQECGLAKSGTNWNTLAERLDRLSKSTFIIDYKRGGKNYHVVTGMMKWGEEKETGNIFIRLDPDGAALFENLAYQPWDIRLSLSSDVATLLLTYISGHEQGRPHSQTVENLKKWCGYAGTEAKFRPSCEAALHELETKGVLVKGSVGIRKGAKDVVYWVREKTRQPAIEGEK